MLRIYSHSEQCTRSYSPLALIDCKAIVVLSGKVIKSTKIFRLCLDNCLSQVLSQLCQPSSFNSFMKLRFCLNGRLTSELILKLMFQNKCSVKLFFPSGNFKLEIPRHSLLQLSSIQLSLIPSETLRLFSWFLSALLKLEYCVHLRTDPEQWSRSRFLFGLSGLYKAQEHFYEEIQKALLFSKECR